MHTVKNRRGHTTTTTYDALNRVDVVTDPLYTVDTDYDDAANTVTVTDRRGIATVRFADDLGRLLRVERAGTKIARYEYDGVGNRTLEEDARDNQVIYGYYANNQLDTTTFTASGTSTKRTYDPAGHVGSVREEDGSTTAYTYDAEGRETAVTRFRGTAFAETTSKRYDALGSLTSVTTPEGTCRIMDYDGLDRLVAVTDDPTSAFPRMLAVGGLDPRCTKRDGLALTTTYAYDPNGNVTDQYTPTGQAAPLHVELTYDERGFQTARIEHVAGATYTTSYTQYDAEGSTLL